MQTLCASMPFCLSHRLKQAASRTCRFNDCTLYPCALIDCANDTKWVASGPSHGRERTTWSRTTYFMMDSFPGAGGCGRNQDYLYLSSRIYPKNTSISELRDIVRKGI